MSSSSSSSSSGPTYYVYLTFDDGPRTGTRNVLGVLADHNIDGTFFLTGHAIITSDREKIVEEVNDAGHLIGNHSDAHWHQNSYYSNPPTGKTNAQWLADYQSNDTKINNVLGTSGVFEHARLPGKDAWRVGSIDVDDGNSKRVADHISSNGYKIYGWDSMWVKDHNGNWPSTQSRVSEVEDCLLGNKHTELPGKCVWLTHGFDFESTARVDMLDDFITDLKNSNLTIEFRTLSTYLSD